MWNNSKLIEDIIALWPCKKKATIVIVKTDFLFDKYRILIFLMPLIHKK